MPHSLTSSPTPSGASSQVSQSNSNYAASLLFQRQNSDSLEKMAVAGSATATAGTAAAAAQPWTPPLWLMSGTDQKHAARTKSQAAPIFKLVVPPIPSDTYEAVKAQLRQEQQLQSSSLSSSLSQKHKLLFMAEQHQIRHYQTKLQEARRHAQDCKVALQNLKVAKEQAHKDIVAQREAEMNKALIAVEKKMREEYDEKAKERKGLWKKRVEEECEVERKRLREEGEEQRKKEQQEREAKRLKKENTKKGEEGEVSQEQQKEEQKSEPLESDAIKKEVDKLQAEADNLNEQRTEMIWLLKQVIKADQKRKSKIEAEKKSSKN